MSDRVAAERACKDPNPIIDGRKANVNLAYLGAKPRIQAGGTCHKLVVEWFYSVIYNGIVFLYTNLVKLKKSP